MCIWKFETNLFLVKLGFCYRMRNVNSHSILSAVWSLLYTFIWVDTKCKDVECSVYTYYVHNVYTQLFLNFELSSKTWCAFCCKPYFDSKNIIHFSFIVWRKQMHFANIKLYLNLVAYWRPQVTCLRLSIFYLDRCISALTDIKRMTNSDTC